MSGHGNDGTSINGKVENVMLCIELKPMVCRYISFAMLSGHCIALLMHEFGVLQRINPNLINQLEGPVGMIAIIPSMLVTYFSKKNVAFVKKLNLVASSMALAAIAIVLYEQESSRGFERLPLYTIHAASLLNVLILVCELTNMESTTTKK